MADGELGFKVELGHGAISLGKVKKRVVAEASGAVGGFKDQAFDRAFGGVERLAVARCNEYAAVPRRALERRDAFEPLKEDDVVPDIRIVVGVGRVDEAGVSGKTGGTDPGSAVEGIDFEAGIVGHDNFTFSELGVVNSFEASVVSKSGAGFLRSRNAGQIGQGIDGDGVGSRSGTKVAQLSLAGCRNKEAKGHKRSVTGGGAGGSPEFFKRHWHCVLESSHAAGWIRRLGYTGAEPRTGNSTSLVDRCFAGTVLKRLIQGLNDSIELRSATPSPTVFRLVEIEEKYANPDSLEAPFGRSAGFDRVLFDGCSTNIGGAHVRL